MSTGMTIGLLSIIAVSIAIAVAATIRAIFPQRARPSRAAGISLDPDDTHYPRHLISERLEYSARPIPRDTAPGAGYTENIAQGKSKKSHANEPSIEIESSVYPFAEAAVSYDPDNESEDDVPTTLFRDGDAEEIEAFIADMELDNAKR